MWVCYFLTNKTMGRTYIGITKETTIDRRLRQHNGEIAGGAKYTRGDIWNRLCYISGFPNKQSVLQFEWSWKYISKKLRENVLDNRLKALFILANKDKWTSKSMSYSDYHDPLTINIENSIIARLLDNNKYYIDNYVGQLLINPLYN